MLKNVSKGPAFLWQMQIQTIEYDLNVTIRIKKKEVILILHSVTLSLWYDFSNDLDSQIDFGKFLSLKCWSLGTFLILYV